MQGKRGSMYGDNVYREKAMCMERTVCAESEEGSKCRGNEAVCAEAMCTEGTVCVGNKWGSV